MKPKLKAMTGLLKSMTLAAGILISSALVAQDSGFIYGKVTTEEGDIYEGPIRWGKEEVYWTDMFNASKEENKNLDYLTDDELDYLEDRRRGSDGFINLISVSWDWDDEDFVHEFSCAFGNIKSLDIRSRSKVDLELRNGEVIRVNGSGYNDIGAKLRVLDEEFGKVELSWSKLERIEFLPTPRNLDRKFGEPLYGTVESDFGRFTGFVQWDHDERVSEDVLDGETRDADLSIEFGKIESIERYGYNRSIVVMQSGRELELRGSNDVNDDNKGIIVTTEGFGRIDLEWEDFDQVTFKEAPNSGASYESFADPEKLVATVTVDNGDVHKGQIIYDLDEEYSFEVLNGEDDDTKYIIPFKNIASIAPKDDDRSTIKLKDGTELVLEDSQDVSEKNQGVLVKTRTDRVYVPWERVAKIEFE